MKALLVALLAALALSVTATAGNPSLCKGSGWQTAQSGSGQAFASQKECAKSKDVYRPSLSIPPAVNAGQTFSIAGQGFHPSEGVSISFAITGQAPYLTLSGASTDSAGDFTQWTFFTGCGTSPPYYLTLTMTDAHGVHASASLVLC